MQSSSRSQKIKVRMGVPQVLRREILARSFNSNEKLYYSPARIFRGTYGGPFRSLLSLYIFYRRPEMLIDICSALLYVFVVFHVYVV